MKSKIFYLVLLVGLSACKEEVVEPEMETDIEETFDLNDFHIAFKIDGEQKTFVPDGITTGLFIAGTGSISTFGDPEEENITDRSGGIETVSGDDFLEISHQFTYTNGEFAADYKAAIMDKFAAGEYNYRIEEDFTTEDNIGMLFNYRSVELGSLRTNRGNQTDSFFIITEIVEIDDDGPYTVIVRGIFNCKLYNTDMISYKVTDGTFYLLFEV